jgi:hypothetical protein
MVARQSMDARLAVLLRLLTVLLGGVPEPAIIKIPMLPHTSNWPQAASND